MAHAEKILRIVLIGKTGVGKSAAGNAIIGGNDFMSLLSSSSVTQECQKQTCQFEGQDLVVIDTPGLFETERNTEELKTEIVRCISFAAPGPHVFLVVIQPNRFTKEEQETMKIIQEMFGKEAACYTIALFTHGDALEEDGVTIEDFVHGNKVLSEFIDQCGGRYHVFNNRSNDELQVRELLGKINRMVQNNGGTCYTNEMFEKAEKAIQENMVTLLRDNPNLKPEEARKKSENNWFNWAAAVTATATVIVAAGVIMKSKACVIQ